MVVGRRKRVTAEALRQIGVGDFANLAGREKSRLAELLCMLAWRDIRRACVPRPSEAALEGKIETDGAIAIGIKLSPRPDLTSLLAAPSRYQEAQAEYCHHGEEPPPVRPERDVPYPSFVVSVAVGLGCRFVSIATK